MSEHSSLTCPELYRKVIYLYRIDVVRTTRGTMKCVDPSLTTNGEGLLQLTIDAEARRCGKWL